MDWTALKDFLEKSEPIERLFLVLTAVFVLLHYFYADNPPQDLLWAAGGTTKLPEQIPPHWSVGLVYKVWFCALGLVFAKQVFSSVVVNLSNWLLPQNRREKED